MSTDSAVERVWMVTGAARGFGARIVAGALEHGAAVVATARDVKALHERFGERPLLLALALDVTNEAQAQAAAAAAVARFGRIDVLVNNAGYGLVGAVEGLTEALYDELAPLGIHATVVEPGYFRTDFLDSTSLASSKAQIDDYAATAGAVRTRAEALNHQQPGDPERLARALLELVEAAAPPLRLPLGSDAIARIGDKHALVERELAAWRGLAASTDFPPGR